MCLGPFGRICHWGPLTALGIIKCVTGMTVYCNNMWWPPSSSVGALFNTFGFMSLSALTLYNFMSAVFHGPGYLPLKWKPKNGDCKYLQWCGVCQGYKAPRSHHCRKCGRCVLKMDHHCPWINNCVGWGNHAHFTAFLGFAVLGCLHGAVVLSCSLYRGLNRVWYIYYGTGNEPIVHFNIYSLILCIFSLGLAIGVVLAVGMLFYFQIRAIIRNRTGIEDWILEKAIHRRQGTDETFVYPYDIGGWNNVKQVINWSCEPVGDGIFWPVAQGCNQYSLTREQMEQKTEKRQRTRLYSIISPVSGSWLPITKGWRVCIHPPCTDEARIRLQTGDVVQVTRWRRYWLFGEKLQSELPEGQQSLERVRGWFPRQCAVEIIDDSSTSVLENCLGKKDN